MTPPDLDVRNLGRRTQRAVISIVVGLVGAFAIAFLIPTTDHFPYWFHTCFPRHHWFGIDGCDPFLVACGVVGISLGCYGLLGLWSWAPLGTLPAARIHVRVRRSRAATRTATAATSRG
jgi:hypothetical protein